MTAPAAAAAASSSSSAAAAASSRSYSAIELDNDAWLRDYLRCWRNENPRAEWKGSREQVNALDAASLMRGVRTTKNTKDMVRQLKEWIAEEDG
jgi:hypothetical protein